MIKVELHAHTADDPNDRIPYTSAQLIDRAAELGYGAVAITLHDRQLDTRWLARYAAERRVVLIPGIERTIQGKHVLLLNFSRRTESVRTFSDVARLKAREPLGLVIAPHAFFPGATCLGAALDAHADLFDAVEWNAMFTRRINFNLRAMRWAVSRGKPVVGNGDVHRLHQLGTTYSMVEAPADADAICAAISEGRVTFEAHPLPLVTAVTTVGSLVAEDLRASWTSRSSSRAPARAEG